MTLPIGEDIRWDDNMRRLDRLIDLSERVAFSLERTKPTEAIRATNTAARLIIDKQMAEIAERALNDLRERVAAAEVDNRRELKHEPAVVDEHGSIGLSSVSGKPVLVPTWGRPPRKKEQNG